MREDNLLLGKKLANLFHKKYGIITYSGTLSIEVALTSLNLKENAKILVSSEVCYSIINTILKENYIPVIVEPINGLYLTDKDIIKVLETENIDCILLVHQYGILNDIDIKEYKKKGIKIIEDIAQAWNIKGENYYIGKDSDIVVTSFGKTKPLSYGIGGGLFFNDKTILEKIDFCDNKSREENSILLSYAYPLCNDINYNTLIQKANNIVQEQRDNATKYYELINKYDAIKCIPIDKHIENVWHRYPIWVDDKKLYKRLIIELETSDLSFQLQHQIELIKLKRNRKCIQYCFSKKKYKFILLRTRNVDIEKQLVILKEIIEKCLLYNDK